MTNTYHPNTLPFTNVANTDPFPNRVGVAFTVDTNVSISGIYFHNPVANQLACHVDLWVDGGNLLHIAVDMPDAGDNYVPFDSAVALTPGHEYIASFSRGSDGGGFNHFAYNYTPIGGSEIVEGVFHFATNSGRYKDTDDAIHPPDGVTTSWYGVGPYIASAPPLLVSAASPLAGQVGTEVDMSASASNAVGGVTWGWAQTSGATQTLAGAATASPSFTPTSAGTFVFRATATDTVTSAHADVTVVVEDAPVIPQTLWVKDDSGTWHSFASGDSGGAHVESWVFYPEDYGAVGDGTTDDTAAINSCIAAAIAAAPTNNFSVKVKFRSRVYCVAAAPTIGQNYGNSQITIPHIVGSSFRKHIFTLEGSSDAAQFLYWGQTQSVLGGTTFKSTLTSPVSDGTFGTPSVIGGPTNLAAAPQDAMATFSNMLLVLDGILVQLPHYKAIGGFNFSRIAQVHVKSASVFTELTLTSTPPLSQLPPDDNSYGMIMPVNGNNARNQVDAFTAEGVGVGMVGGEHLIATFLGFVYCRYGLGVVGNSGTAADGSKRPIAHSYWVGHMLAEGVTHWVYSINGAAQLVIDLLDGEGIVNFTDHILDSSNNLFGHVNLNDINQEVPVVTGGANLRVLSDGQQLGARTAPSVPSSATALKNPFYRDAVVVVAGGTVSKIEVNGVDQHVTAGPIVVPSGASIKVTYSAAPTWAWNLS